MSKKRIIVVGNGMVGHNFIDTLANSDNADQFDILTFSEEPRLAYDRVQLSKYFSGATADDLALTTSDEYDGLGVVYTLNDKVVGIDADNKTVTTASGRVEGYDKLVLATGSYPFVPPIPGKDQEHCLVYRTIEDLEAISASSAVSKTGVVVGGGLLGLEAANALKQAGLDTHVVEFAPRLMAVQLDDGGVLTRVVGHGGRPVAGDEQRGEQEQTHTVHSICGGLRERDDGETRAAFAGRAPLQPVLA